MQTDTDRIKELEQLLKDEKEKTTFLLKLKSKYEENGAAKLYYSLQRKMNEMADTFNKNSLDEIDMEKKADATFDRIFKLLEKSEVVANASKTAGLIAGVTGDEEKDVKQNRNITPENISDVLGNTAGQHS